MGKAVGDSHLAQGSGGHRLDWRKRMSDNVALALIVYTGLQIFVTVHALKQGFPSMLAYIALVLLVAAIIPACRAFERRWLHISDQAASDVSLRSGFQRDQMLLWALAIGLPFVITGFFKAVFAAF